MAELERARMEIERLREQNAKLADAKLELEARKAAAKKMSLKKEAEEEAAKEKKAMILKKVKERKAAVKKQEPNQNVSTAWIQDAVTGAWYKEGQHAIFPISLINATSIRCP